MITLRTRRNPRRLSFAKTFGTTTALTDCNFDKNLSNFNQNIPNPTDGDPALPEACTCFARCDTATNEDAIIYDPLYTYQHSCLLENVPFGSPLLLQTPYDSARTDGLKAISEAPGNELTHHRGPYFEIHPTWGQDYFDAFWSALLTGQKPFSAGTVWYPEMNNMTNIDVVNIRPTTDGHAYEICGVVTTDQPRLVVKWWGGELKYFGRAAINALMAQQGSDAIMDMDGKATPADLHSVGFITLLRQELVNLITRLLS